MPHTSIAASASHSQPSRALSTATAAEELLPAAEQQHPHPCRHPLLTARRHRGRRGHHDAATHACCTLSPTRTPCCLAECSFIPASPQAAAPVQQEEEQERSGRSRRTIAQAVSVVGEWCMLPLLSLNC